jgi:hypothetical protein
MPRRVLAEHESIWQELNATGTAAELSSTLVDFKIIEMVIPNHESERQPA